MEYELKKIVRIPKLSEIETNLDDYWIEISNDRERLDDIKRLFKESIKIEELYEIYKANVRENMSEYYFYTDGSLMEINNKKKMGLGWILCKNENDREIYKQFKAANYGWPASSKAEVLAILTALITVTKNATVKIFTDSSNAINQYEKYKKETSKRKKSKIAYHISWEMIFYIIISK